MDISASSSDFFIFTRRKPAEAGVNKHKKPPYRILSVPQDTKDGFSTLFRYLLIQMMDRDMQLS